MTDGGDRKPIGAGVPTMRELADGAICHMDVFIHIPKTSGSTIRSILSRQYGVEKISYFEPAASTWKQKKISPVEFLKTEIANGAQLITGHYPFGIHALLKAPCRYFSMLRDPIERSLSEYYYAFSYEHHRFRDEITSGTLPVDEFLTTPRCSPPNAQAAMLAGPWRSFDGELGAAIENIRTSFVVVGTAERFDESILVIAKAFGWTPPLFVNTNVTKLDDETYVRRAAAREARDKYRRYFATDYELYNFADIFLSRYIEREGTLFNTALDAFREIQADIAAHSSDDVFRLYELRSNDPLPAYASRFVGSEPYRQIERYLQSETSTRGIGRNYVGRVDVAEGRTVVGWAVDLSRSDPIEVTAWHSGQRLLSTRCDIVREDLLVAGFPFGRIGFRMELPLPILDKGSFCVCFDETPICLPASSTTPTDQQVSNS
jgi:Sulfotransferase family